MEKDEFGVLLRLTRIVTTEDAPTSEAGAADGAEIAAEDSTAKFCLLLAPVSRSLSSFTSRPSLPRSIHKPAFAKMELIRIRLPVPEITETPFPELNAMMFARFVSETPPM